MPDRPYQDPEEIIVPFIFVPHGEKEPEEWLRRHASADLIRIPAVFIPDPVPTDVGPDRPDEPAEARTTQARPAPAAEPRPPAAPPIDPDPVATYLRIDRHLTAQGLGHASRPGASSDAPPRQPADPPPPANALEAARERAFLRLIRWTENGDVPDDKAYHARYGGNDPMTDEELRHYVPKIVVLKGRDGKPHRYTAAGAYQITRETWIDASAALRVEDFAPATQDRIARWLIARDHAHDEIRQGRLIPAFQKLRGTWPALPGGDQTHHSLDEAQRQFTIYLDQETARDRP